MTLAPSIGQASADRRAWVPFRMKKSGRVKKLKPGELLELARRDPFDPFDVYPDGATTMGTPEDSLRMGKAVLLTLRQAHRLLSSAEWREDGSMVAAGYGPVPADTTRGVTIAAVSGAGAVWAGAYQSDAAKYAAGLNRPPTRVEDAVARRALAYLAAFLPDGFTWSRWTAKASSDQRSKNDVLLILERAMADLEDTGVDAAPEPERAWGGFPLEPRDEVPTATVDKVEAEW